MFRTLSALSALALAQACAAQMPSYDYFVGNVKVTGHAHATVVHVDGAPVVENLPAGHTWPKLLIDDAGLIYAGGVVIDSENRQVLRDFGPASQALPGGLSVTIEKGGYRVARHGRHCRFTPQQLGLRGGKPPLDAMKDDNVSFGASAAQVLALVSQYDDEQKGRYLVAHLDLARCEAAMTDIGNPDLLVELGSSARGGWWLTGSIEQTLLRSPDGRAWRRAALPPDVSSLVSSHVVSDDEIWLAAALPGSGDDDPLLVLTLDGGRTWRNIRSGDPALARVPRGWLEGRKRVAQAKAHSDHR